MYMLSVAGHLNLIQKKSTYKVPHNGGVLVLSKFLWELTAIRAALKYFNVKVKVWSLNFTWTRLFTDVHLRVGYKSWQHHYSDKGLKPLLTQALSLTQGKISDFKDPKQPRHARSFGFTAALFGFLGFCVFSSKMHKPPLLLSSPCKSPGDTHLAYVPFYITTDKHVIWLNVTIVRGITIVTSLYILVNDLFCKQTLLIPW